jgi:hypothetical protein
MNLFFNATKENHFSDNQKLANPLQLITNQTKIIDFFRFYLYFPQSSDKIFARVEIMNSHCTILHGLFFGLKLQFINFLKKLKVAQTVDENKLVM